jgi:predicted NUDIX family NTP pyrophosphohydrolase
MLQSVHALTNARLLEGASMDLHSAGVLLYRFNRQRLEVLLAHPGGPYFENRDDGVWSIPKGLRENNEELLDTARREFEEETGTAVDGHFIALGTVRLRSGKTVYAWALEKDVDASTMVSNTFQMEWPRHSGQIREYPEMDMSAWFSLQEARVKITAGQLPFIDRLVEVIKFRA